MTSEDLTAYCRGQTVDHDLEMALDRQEAVESFMMKQEEAIRRLEEANRRQQETNLLQENINARHEKEARAWRRSGFSKLLKLFF